MGPKDQTASSGRVKVLLADDSITMHRAVALGLKNEAYQMITCDNGQDAFRLALEHKPTFLLADLDMPGLTGVELSQKIKRHPDLKSIKIILLCGSFDKVDENRIQEAEADGRLWKPFESQALIALLKTLGKDLIRQPSDPTALGSEKTIEKAPTQKSHSQKSPAQNSPGRMQDAERELTEQTFLQVNPPPESKDEGPSSLRITDYTTEHMMGEPEVPAPGSYSLSDSLTSSNEDPVFMGSELPEPTQDFERPDLRPDPRLTQMEEDEEALSAAQSEVAAENIWNVDLDENQNLGKSSPHSVTNYATDSNPYEDSPPPPTDFEVVTTPINVYSTSATNELPNPPSRPPPPPTRRGFQENQEGPDSSLSSLIETETWKGDSDFSKYSDDEHIPFEGAPDHSNAAAMLQGLSEVEIRAIIREEIREAMEGWLKKTLEQQLQSVIAEIDQS